MKQSESANWRPVISVDPVDGGWRVNGELCGEALMFLSGGRAEAQARALARRLASIGFDTLVEIHDRANTLAGVVRYPADRRHDRVSGCARP
jgi:hypothetical protein